MPVKYRCRHCGYVLWEFKHVGQDCYGLPTPTEVMNVYGGICPNCKRELRSPGLNDIKIRYHPGKPSAFGEEGLVITPVQGLALNVQEPEKTYIAEA